MEKIAPVKLASIIFSVLILCFAVINISSAIWASPTVAAPGANVSAPLNVSNNAQYKVGGLIINCGASSTCRDPSSASTNGLSIPNGNVSIGNTSPRAKFEIYGTNQKTADITDSGDHGSALFLNSNNSGKGSGGEILFGGMNNTHWFATIKGLLENGSTNSIGNIAFSTRNAVADTALTERMRIAYNGYVGIGDTSPANLLTVGSGDKFQVNSSGNIVKINNITYSWPSAQGAANRVLTNNGSGTLTWGAGTGLWNDKTTYITPNTTSIDDQFVIMDTGLTGLGTINPIAKLDITLAYPNINNIGLNVLKNYNGGGNGVITAKIVGKDGSIGETGLYIAKKGSSSFSGTGNFVWQAVANGSPIITQLYNGYVGMGVATPTTSLVVNGNNSLGQIELTNSSSTSYSAGMGVSNGSTHVITGDALGDLSIWANTGASGKINFSANYGSTNQMVLLRNGNVGIGNTDPKSKLTVGSLNSGNISPTVFINNVSAVTAISGSALSDTLVVQGADIGTTVGSYSKISSFGIKSSNNETLGVTAYRNTTASSWNGLAMGLQYNVDNTSTGPGGSLWFYNNNIGIGTTAPTAPLTVNGSNIAGQIKLTNSINTTETAGMGVSGENNQILDSDVIGSFNIWSSKSINFSAAAGPTTAPIQMTLLNNGKVGIGTTAPSHFLDVGNDTFNGPAYIRVNSASGKVTGLQLATAGTTEWYLYKTNDTNNDFRIRSATGDSFIIQQATSNVGIGDTSPANLLTVGSGDKFQVNSSGNIVKINNITYSWPSTQGVASTYLKNDGSGNLSWSATGISGTGTTNYFPYWINTTTLSNTSSLYFNNSGVAIGGYTNAPVNGMAVSGNVGIGTTTSINAPLVVNGNNSLGQMKLTNSSSTSYSAGMGVSNGSTHVITGDALGDLSIWANTGASGKINFSANYGSTNQMVLLRNGNVGIGNTNPVIDLAIGDTDTGLNLASDGNIGIYTNNNERIRINSSGNVGIGTTSLSTNKLEIVGGNTKTTGGLIIQVCNGTFSTHAAQKGQMWLDGSGDCN